MEGQTRPSTTFVYPHDVGYKQEAGLVVVRDIPHAHWELQMHAALVILENAKPPFMTDEELRRGIEVLDQHTYDTWSYYERWAASISAMLIERGVITTAELHAELGLAHAESTDVQFGVGDVVRIRHEDPTRRFKKPHLRTPGYVFGLRGEVTRYLGLYPDPGLAAFRLPAPRVPLYSVRISLSDIKRRRSSSRPHGSSRELCKPKTGVEEDDEEAAVSLRLLRRPVVLTPTAPAPSPPPEPSAQLLISGTDFQKADSAQEKRGLSSGSASSSSPPSSSSSKLLPTPGPAFAPDRRGRRGKRSSLASSELLARGLPLALEEEEEPLCTPLGETMAEIRGTVVVRLFLATR